MARTTITPQQATSAGLVPNPEPANIDGNAFQPRPGRCLRVENGSASTVTLTLPTPGTVDGLQIENRTIAVAAGVATTIAVGKGDVYRQPGGVVYVDYSAAPATLKVAVLDIP